MTKLIKPAIAWGLTTVASLIDYLKDHNNIGKEEQSECLIEYENEIWKLEKQNK